jgi:predicted Zn-dependent protease
MKKVAALLILCVLLSGCATVYNPATARQDKVSMLMSPYAESILGGYYYAQMRSSYGGKIHEDPELTAIGQRLVSVSDRRDDFKYRFLVVDEPEPNAFTASGGYIYVTKGLLDMASSKDEVACVVAHELGHDACRHMAKKMPAIVGYQLFMGIISSSTKEDKQKDIQRIVGIMYQIISNGYSRQDEREADKLAVRYAKNAGYDPNAFITFFEKMQKRSSQVYIPWLSSHPSDKERIENARKEIAQLQQAGG